MGRSLYFRWKKDSIFEDLRNTFQQTIRAPALTLPFPSTIFSFNVIVSQVAKMGWVPFKKKGRDFSLPEKKRLRLTE
jgi:hypothetical protein